MNEIETTLAYRLDLRSTELTLAMTNAQTRIANTIHHFYDDSAPMGQCGIKYKETVEKLDEEAKKDMVCQQT